MFTGLSGYNLQMTEETTQKLVSKVEAEYLYRGAYLSGFLTLTEEWLHFARMSPKGAEIIWKTRIRAVDSADIDMVRDTVTFEFQGNRFTVRGNGTFALHKEFVTQFWSLSREDDERLIAHGETTLLEGEASLSLDSGIRMEGSLAVTGKGIRFLSNTAIDARKSAIQGLSAPLERITGLKLSGMSRGLELRVGNHTYQFWGQIVPKVYGVLTTLIGHRQHDPNSQTDILTWTIGRFRGFVLQYGELLVSNRKLTFVPTGKLDSLIGLDQEWHLKREVLQSIAIEGIGGRKLAIRSIDQNDALFEQPKARAHFVQFLEVLLHDPRQSTGRSRLPTMDTPRLFPWKSVLKTLTDGQMLYSSPCFRMHGEFNAEYGSLILGVQSTLFLPNKAQPTEDDIVTLRTERLRPPEPGQLPIGVVELDDGSENVRLLLGNKSVFTTEFWTLWRNEMDRSGKGHFHPSLKPGGENRREAYRAELPHTISTDIFLLNEDGQEIQAPISAECLDISIGGCCVVAEEPIPAAPILLIRLPTIEEGRYKNLRFMCAHRIEVGQFGEKWRHGLRFLDLSEKDADEVEELVMKLQRDEAFSRAVRRAGIEE